jgi:hypothetical protein
MTSFFFVMTSLFFAGEGELGEPIPGSAKMQLDASDPLLTRAWLVWRFVLDWVQGRGVWAAMHSALATCRARPR